MKDKSRINKWRKYRENIDNNESIHFSIVNTDLELKNLLSSINFDIEKEYEKAGYKTNAELKEKRKKQEIETQKELESILSIIEKNETIKTKNRLVKDFNSHKFDNIINENFLEFLDKEDLKNRSEQETTDLKIKKINIIDNKK